MLGNRHQCLSRQCANCKGVRHGISRPASLGGCLCQCQRCRLRCLHHSLRKPTAKKSPKQITERSHGFMQTWTGFLSLFACVVTLRLHDASANSSCVDCNQCMAAEIRRNTPASFRFPYSWPPRPCESRDAAKGPAEDRHRSNTSKLFRQSRVHVSKPRRSPKTFSVEHTHTHHESSKPPSSSRQIHQVMRLEQVLPRACHTTSQTSPYATVLSYTVAVKSLLISVLPCFDRLMPASGNTQPSCCMRGCIKRLQNLGPRLQLRCNNVVCVCVQPWFPCIFNELTVIAASAPCNLIAIAKVQDSARNDGMSKLATRGLHMSALLSKARLQRKKLRTPAQGDSKPVASSRACMVGIVYSEFKVGFQRHDICWGWLSQMLQGSGLPARGRSADGGRRRPANSLQRRGL